MGRGDSRVASICLFKIAQAPALPGLLLYIFPELICEVRGRTFGDRCARQLLREDYRNLSLLGQLVGTVQACACESYMNRQPVQPPCPTVKVKPLKWKVDRGEQVAAALKQHLRVVGEENALAAAKAEVKKEDEKIFQF